MTLETIHTRRVIPAAEFGQISEIAEIVASARRAAADIVEKAEHDRQERRREGYQDGFAEGLRKVSDSLSGATRQAERDLRDLDNWIGAIVLKAVALIVGSMDADERVRRIIARALADATGTQRSMLHVPPEDEVLVRRAAEGLGHTLDIVVDPLLSPQQMVIETSLSRTHIGLREQFAALAEAAGLG